MTQPPAKVCGIDVEILEECLEQLRQLYPVTDKANNILEERTGTSGLSIGITNQRDALSHFVTLLQNPAWSRDKQKKQLAHIEEHLRRAILESYVRAVTIQLRRIEGLHKKYRRTHWTRRSKGRNCPPPDQIQQTIEDAHSARLRAREIKALNEWTPEWEEGVSALVESSNALDQLEHRLESCMDQSVTVILALVGILLAILGMIIGVLFSDAVTGLFTSVVNTAGGLPFMGPLRRF